MKPTPLSILNAFACTANKRLRGHLATTIVIAIVTVSIAICTWMAIHDIKPKFVFMIDAVEIGGADSLTIGRGSDVSYNGVPTDYLTVKAKADGSMDWHKNPLYTDSLQYLKINNANPNIHNVRNDNTQPIVIRLPYATTPDGHDSIITVKMTGADVWKAWNTWEEQQNIMARHLAAKLRIDAGAKPDETRKLRNTIDIQKVKSFFNATHSNLTGHLTAIHLVVLDNNTTIDGKGYNTSGNTYNTGTTRPADDKDCCKVQFVNISSGCYRTADDDGFFQIDSVNYVMKTPPMLTEWGAGHIMIRHTKDGMRAVFPKAIGYVGSVDSLRNVAQQASGLITFRQNGTNFPTAGDLYLPQFSNAFGQDICNLHFTSADNNIIIRDANTGEHTVKAHTFSLLPILPKVTLHSGDNTLECRAGIINSAFFMSYLWLPLIATLVILFIILGPLSPFRGKDSGAGIYAQRQLKQLPAYLACLFTIAMGYCVCKSLIAIKLSYTFPYFEKITAITPVTTTLMLVVAFTIVMILNHAVMTYSAGHRTAKRRKPSGVSRLKAWTAWTLMAAVFALTVYAFFGILDKGVSSAVIDSYFKHEIGFTNAWWSEKAYGVNDNHRTIPYALITIEAILLILAAAAITLSPWLQHLWEWADQAIDAYNRILSNAGRTLARITGLKALADTYRRTARRNASKAIWRWTLGSAFAEALTVIWRTLWPGHLILILAMAIIGPRLGNFGTAFITLGVIVGLCRALTNVRIADTAHPADGSCSAIAALIAMGGIALTYMLGAMVADNGYLTNLLGFVMALLCFFNIMERPGPRGSAHASARRHERLWLTIITIAVTALVVALPYICSHIFSSTEANYSRSVRRIMLYSNFDNLQRSGYRYAESDAEFMVIMSHYMQTQSDGDALSNDTHPLHPSVSTGQSPVVLNDLSVPAAFFGAYGARPATAVYFLMLLALLILVIHFSVNYDPERGDLRLTRAMQWRLLAVFMWVGTSYYIYFSYIDWMPFTGRLNPGFGVDAVGEALESAVLLAFMGAVTLRRPKELQAPTPQHDDEDDEELASQDQQPDVMLPPLEEHDPLEQASPTISDAPLEEQPAPVEEQPVPVEEHSVPIEEQPDPVEAEDIQDIPTPQVAPAPQEPETDSPDEDVIYADVVPDEPQHAPAAAPADIHATPKAQPTPPAEPGNDAIFVDLLDDDEP